jgi:hypothetical protein
VQPNGEVKLLVTLEHNDVDYRLKHISCPVFDPPARPRLVCSVQVTDAEGATATAQLPLGELLSRINNLIWESTGRR